MAWPEVILATAKEFALPYADVAGRKRDRFTCRARFALYKALRMRGASYVQIAKWLDRDHSTVIHGVRVAEETMEKEPVYKERVHRISQVQAGGVIVV